MRKKDGKVGNKTVRKKIQVESQKKPNKQIQILSYANARKTKSCLITSN